MSKMWCSPGNNFGTSSVSPHCLTYSEPRMYVDDTSLTLASTDINHINYCLNHKLGNVYERLSANKLTLNMTKTEFILIASRQKL